MASRLSRQEQCSVGETLRAWSKFKTGQNFLKNVVNLEIRERVFKPAFTLAEVLITLGIIGVVAAMTIPTLIANTNSAKYRSQFKKTISTLSQAARLNQANYGFDYAGLSAVCDKNAGTHNPENVMSICAIFNANLSGSTYFASAADIPMKKGNKSSGYYIDSAYISQFSTKDISKMKAYILADGTIVAFHKDFGKYPCALAVGSVLKDTYVDDGTLNSMANCYGFIDVNGTALPNKEVSCSSGSNLLSDSDCVVKNDTKHMTDIYPVRFHDGIVEPTTAAGRYVLKTAK